MGCDIIYISRVLSHHNICMTETFRSAKAFPDIPRNRIIEVIFTAGDIGGLVVVEMDWKHKEQEVSSLGNLAGLKYMPELNHLK